MNTFPTNVLINIDIAVQWKYLLKRKIFERRSFSITITSIFLYFTVKKFFEKETFNLGEFLNWASSLRMRVHHQ